MKTQKKFTHIIQFEKDIFVFQKETIKKSLSSASKNINRVTIS